MRRGLLMRRGQICDAEYAMRICDADDDVACLNSTCNYHHLHAPPSLLPEVQVLFSRDEKDATAQDSRIENKCLCSTQTVAMDGRASPWINISSRGTCYPC